MSEINGKFPPGWDSKYDQNTGKCYYINYFTKAMSLEDPRIKYRQFQNEKASNESIQMQPLHGSPYHIYPTCNYPAVQAFQEPRNHIYNNNNNVSGSPLLMKTIQQVTNSPHSATRILTNNLQKQNLQETSFIAQADTDISVSRISTMFPTASEPHIRLLLKKYHNREAVVISALQVEKFPFTQPGPYSTPSNTPPMSRFDPNSSPLQRPLSRASGTYDSYGSPRDAYRNNAGRPHSSPKMKLRYLKSVFPKADETLLLDILANADNNVQKASEQLIVMGYEKRDTTAPKLSNRSDQAAKTVESVPAPPVQPKILTNEEKTQIKAQLQNQYKTIPEKVITMALESVDFSETKAGQILKIVLQEDEKDVRSHEIHTVDKSVTVENNATPKKARPSVTTDTSSETTTIKQSTTFESMFERTNVRGPNSQLCKGPNESILLADYIAWNGANPDLCHGRQEIPLGPDKSLRQTKLNLANGPNKELCKGSNSTLTKGSVYNNLRLSKNVKCN